MINLRVGASATHAQMEPTWPRGDLDRVAVTREFDRLPGRHPALVRHSILAKYDLDQERVHNSSDIDSAKTDWARDMGENQNRPLLEYFRGRKVWALDGDRSPPQLEPYSVRIVR
jgi:hypothetical protein